MTRRLSAVPDAPRSGVDLAEARRSLGLPQPAAPRSAEPSSATPTDSLARARLREAQSALQRKLDAAEHVAGNLRLLHQQLDEIREDRVKLEAQRAGARQPIIAWQQDPLSGPCPSLGESARATIREASDRLEELADRERAVNAAIGRLEGEQQQTQRWIGPAQREIQSAVAAVLLEADDACRARVQETFAAFQRARSERLAIRSMLQGTDADWRAEQIRRELDVVLPDPSRENVSEQLARYGTWSRALESDASASLPEE